MSKTLRRAVFVGEGKDLAVCKVVCVYLEAFMDEEDVEYMFDDLTEIIAKYVAQRLTNEVEQ